MSDGKKIFVRIIASIASILLVGLAGLLVKFGYMIIREDAQDTCYMNGGSIVFYPDTRWFGVAAIILIGAAYLLAKALNKPMGVVLAVLLALCGIGAIVVPELIQ